VCKGVYLFATSAKDFVTSAIKNKTEKYAKKDRKVRKDVDFFATSAQGFATSAVKK